MMCSLNRLHMSRRALFPVRKAHVKVASFSQSFIWFYLLTKKKINKWRSQKAEIVFLSSVFTEKPLSKRERRPSIQLVIQKSRQGFESCRQAQVRYFGEDREAKTEASRSQQQCLWWSSPWEENNQEHLRPTSTVCFRD